MADILGAMAALEEESAPAAPAAETETPAVSSTLAVEAPKETAVVLCGTSDWPQGAKGASGKAAQKRDGARGDEFNAPVVINSLKGIRVLSLAVGPCAGHMLALTESGMYAWGLNASGQLGLGPSGGWCMPGPTPAPLWNVDGDRAVSAAVGNKHTLVVYASGTVLSAGCGDRGALGYGEKEKDLPLTQDTPKAVVAGGNVEGGLKAVCVAAGCDYSLAADGNGKMYAWGWTEHGKLGLGTDGQYNMKDSSVKITFSIEGEPKVVALPDDDAGKVVQVSAGKHHSACLTNEGFGYTWGDNGYGKLGHRDQKERHSPTKLPMTRFSTLLCGDASSCGLGWPDYPGRPFGAQLNDGLVYHWGVLKGSNGEGATHPVPNYEIQGWTIDKHCFAMGATHVALAGEGSAVAWAQSPVAFGQLGLGPDAPKSTHTAKQMEGLADVGLVCAQVVASSGQTHLLCDAATVAKLPTWDPPTEALTKPPEKVRAPPKKKAKT